MSTTGWIEVPGARLYYEVAGEGEPVVLLHGGLVDLRMWDDQFDVFAQRHRVVRFDMRSFGRTEVEPVPFSLIDDVLAVMDGVGFDRAALVGLSAGGGVELELALAHPERVRALVAVGPGLPGYDWSDAMGDLDGRVGAAEEAGDIDAAVEHLTDYWTVAQREKSEVDPKVLARVREMTRLLFTNPNVEEHEQRDRTTIDRLAEIGAPILLVVGEQDVPDIHAIADLIARDAPNVERASIPGGHHPNMDSPAEFNALVLDFLARH